LASLDKIREMENKFKGLGKETMSISILDPESMENIKKTLNILISEK